MKALESSPSSIISECDERTSLNGLRRAPLTPADRQKLILENLSEVRYIARRIYVRLPQHVPFDDLVHEGVLGLIDAVEKFDPSKNVLLPAYARFRIRGAILDSLRGLDWGPRRLRRQSRRIERASKELAVNLGRVPSEQEVADRLDVPLQELQQILMEIHCLRVETLRTSCDLLSNQEGFNGRSHRADDDPFDRCFIAERTRVLGEALARLTQKAQQALTLYYFEERTMKEIGRVLHVQESRVSQIITGALSRLRVIMQNDQHGGARSESKRDDRTAQ